MTKDNKIIIGSGGGGSKAPPPPTRTPDNLHSRQFGTFLDLISEGEIEGFATASKEGRTKGTAAYNNAALKDVFLNDTPVLRSTADSTNPQTADFNFQSVSFVPKFGEANQTKVDGIESSSSTTSVGVEPKNADGTTSGGIADSVTRRIADKSPNTNPDRIRVTISIPIMHKQKDNGDILGSSVELKIQIQYNN